MSSPAEKNDLDILFPDVRRQTFFTAKDGKRYSFNYFIPAGIALLSSVSDEADNTGLKRQLRILECFLQKQYEHMTADWIEENIPLQFQNAIYGKIVKEMQKSNSILGED